VSISSSFNKLFESFYISLINIGTRLLVFLFIIYPCSNASSVKCTYGVVSLDFRIKWEFVINTSYLNFAPKYDAIIEPEHCATNNICFAPVKFDTILTMCVISSLKVGYFFVFKYQDTLIF
jgi:hypothetical protein